MIVHASSEDDPQRGDLRIGEFLVQPRLLRAVGRGETHHLEPKALQVLLRLADSPQQAVSREELFVAVWPDVHVTEDVLTRCIYQLRKAFGDTPRAPRYIETIPKVGYRLVVAVESPPRTDAPSSTAHPAAHQEPELRPTSARHLGWTALLGFAAGIALLASLTVGWGIFEPREPRRGEAMTAVGRDGGSPATQSPRIVPLAAETGDQADPAISPDGARIAYSAPGSDGSWDLFVRLAEGGSTAAFVEGPGNDRAPAWSPDGGEIAWLRMDAGSASCEVLRAAYPSGRPRHVARCPPGTERHLAWSPDSRWLASAARDPDHGRYRIWTLSLATGEYRFVTDPPATSIGDYSVAISRDSAQVAFVRGYTLWSEDLFVQPVAGGEPFRLTSDGMAISSVGYSPDGERVLFLSKRAGDFGLWSVALTGGLPQWLGFTAPAASGLSVSARRPRAALVVEHVRTGIWTLALQPPDDSRPADLPASNRIDLGAQPSPEGSRFAWISNRLGSMEIWTSQPGTEAVRLTAFGGPHLGTPRWSRDGTRLAFAAHSAHGADLFLLDLEGDRPRRITGPPFHEVAPRWSADGSSLLFASDRTGEWQVWRLLASGDDPVQVTTSGGFGAVESADGRSLFFTKKSTRGLWRLRYESGVEEQVDDTLDPFDWGNIAAVREGVLFLRRRRFDQARLVRFDSKSARVEEMATLGPVPWESSLGVSPDGDRVYFSRIEELDLDIELLENLF